MRNVEMALAKSDFGIAKLYSDFGAGQGTARARLSQAEGRSLSAREQAVLLVTGQKALLETNPVLARSIRLRNPYVDPMSLIQVELLRRKRARRRFRRAQSRAGRHH